MNQILDESYEVDCPGCGVELTVGNAAGYRHFCATCADAFPPFPKDGRGYTIRGRFPDFEWVSGDVSDDTPH